MYPYNYNLKKLYSSTLTFASPSRLNSSDIFWSHHKSLVPWVVFEVSPSRYLSNIICRCQNRILVIASENQSYIESAYIESEEEKYHY